MPAPAAWPAPTRLLSRDFNHPLEGEQTNTIRYGIVANTGDGCAIVVKPLNQSVGSAAGRVRWKLQSSSRMHIACPFEWSNLCYTEKATKAWHCQGRQKHNKTKNSYKQPKRLSTGTTHRSITVSTAKSTHESSRRKSMRTATLHARQMHPASTTQTHWGHRYNLLVNTTQCVSQVGRAGLQHRHHP